MSACAVIVSRLVFFGEIVTFSLHFFYFFILLVFFVSWIVELLDCPRNFWIWWIKGGYIALISPSFYYFLFIFLIVSLFFVLVFFFLSWALQSRPPFSFATLCWWFTTLCWTFTHLCRRCFFTSWFNLCLSNY